MIVEGEREREGQTETERGREFYVPRFEGRHVGFDVNVGIRNLPIMEKKTLLP